MGSGKKVKKVKEVKLSLWHAVEAHSVVRRLGFHIFLDRRLTDGGVIVSLTPRWLFTRMKISGTHLC
jgi:hypothetical protein